MADSKLTFAQLQTAVRSAAALRCVSRLEPAGGPEDKVFPPTYAGGVYAMEERLVADGDGGRAPKPCVLIDSVQSQANRLEEALLNAYEDGELKMPMMVVDFAQTPDGKKQSDELIAPIGRITALETPHRIADAIFRDSVVADGKTGFRDSNDGIAFEAANIRNATALFRLCPTALVLGTWDSTGSKGGLGNKFARALVSEISGINAVPGVRTGSRIDPLQIGKCELYEDKDGNSTPDESLEIKEKNKLKLSGSGDKKGKPSAINHGNVTPDIVKNDRNEEIGVGVTIDHALQTTVLSLPQLRRLRFPDEDGSRSADRNHAARTVLAALTLVAVTRSRESGCDLRSRCLLVPSEQVSSWEIVRAGDDIEHVAITSDDALELFNAAVKEASAAGLPWPTDEVVLRPSQKLVDLVAKGRRAEMEKGGDA